MLKNLKNVEGFGYIRKGQLIFRDQMTPPAARSVEHSVLNDRANNQTPANQVNPAQPNPNRPTGLNSIPDCLKLPFFSSIFVIL